MIEFKTNQEQFEDLQSAAFLILAAVAGFVAVIVGICFLVARWI